MRAVISFTAALCVLGAYAARQLRWLREDSATYLLLNLFGSAVIALFAVGFGQPAVVLLEGSWAVVSAFALLRVGVNAWRARS